MAVHRCRYRAPEHFTADLASLRDDVTILNSSLSEFIRTYSAAKTNSVFDAVDNARQKISDMANNVHDHAARASTDLETTIEHKPMVAALFAMVAGMLVGLLSRRRR
jgi:ElaB/YqjD/DUF883 family membrane-anchored ribosome-binding protein